MSVIVSLGFRVIQDGFNCVTILKRYVWTGIKGNLILL